MRTLESTGGELGPWFHNLHLPSGEQTAPDHPLGDFPAFKWRQIAPDVPADLSGARALDIGCNAGFYSFELAARGASVLAVDLDERYLRQARWASEQLDPHNRVEFRRMSVYADRVGGRLVLQTLTMPGDAPAKAPEDLPIGGRDALTGPGWPRAAFIERHLAGDPTNWWAPDDACVQAMLRSAGMRVTATPDHEIYVCEPDPEHDHARFFRAAELDAVLKRPAGT